MKQAQEPRRYGGIARVVLLAMMAGAFAVATPGALAGVADVTFNASGVGVGGADNGLPVPEQISQDPELGETQALVIDLGGPVHGVSITVSNLFKSENGCAEVGRWTAFSSFGVQIGSGKLNKLTLNYGGSSNVGTLTVPIAGPLQYLAFSAEPYGEILNPDNDCASPPPNDSSDYLVRYISYEDADNVPGSVGTSGAASPPYASLWPVALYGYEFGTPFVDADGYLLGPDGSWLGAINVGDTECTGGEGESNQSCTIHFTDEFTTTITGGDVEGALRLLGVHTFEDPRAACGGAPDVVTSPLIQTGPYGGEQLNLGFVLGKDAGGNDITGPIVPEHLCGIPTPGSGGVPKIIVLEIDGSKLRVRGSVLGHEVDNPQNTDYSCPSAGFGGAWASAPANRSKLPVVGWLPRKLEIPVLDALGHVSPVLEDVTYACGSYRGGTSALSYLAYNLHHSDSVDTMRYQSIIDDEFNQLRTTVAQTVSCVQKGTQTSTMESKVDKADKWFDNRQYSKSKNELINLRELIYSPTSRIGPALQDCFVDPAQLTAVIQGDPNNPGDLIPRNFRGDLLVQVDHILYMMEAMLNVLSPPRPIPQ